MLKVEILANLSVLRVPLQGAQIPEKNVSEVIFKKLLVMMITLINVSNGYIAICQK